MKRYGRLGHDRWVEIAVVVFILLIGWYYYRADTACRAKGGVLVRTFGYECVQVERIP